MSDGILYRGKVTHAVVVENQKGQKQLEVGVELRERLTGNKVEDGVENIAAIEALTFLHLDEDGDAEEKRRKITRDRVTKMTGVELEMSWEVASGWLRLLPDHPESLIPVIEGKEVMVKSREYNDKTYYDLYWPRERPKAMTMAEVKAKLRPY